MVRTHSQHNTKSCRYHSNLIGLNVHYAITSAPFGMGNVCANNIANDNASCRKISNNNRKSKHLHPM